MSVEPDYRLRLPTTLPQSLWHRGEITSCQVQTRQPAILYLYFCSDLKRHKVSVYTSSLNLSELLFLPLFGLYLHGSAALPKSSFMSLTPNFYRLTGGLFLTRKEEKCFSPKLSLPVEQITLFPHSNMQRDLKFKLSFNHDGNSISSSDDTFPSFLVNARKKSSHHDIDVKVRGVHVPMLPSGGGVVLQQRFSVWPRL